MECSIHHNREATHKCAHCGAPICDSCYESNKLHYCPKCLKKAIQEEAREAESVLNQTKKETKNIKIGLIFGLIVAVIFSAILLIKPDLLDPSLSGGVPWYICIVLLIWVPSVFGSFLTLCKSVWRTIKRTKDLSEDDSDGAGGIIRLIIVIYKIVFCILFAPIVTIHRLRVRKKDIAQVTQIYNDDIAAIPLVERYIANANQPSAVEQAASGEAGDVEISLESILASGVGSDAALCSNGEILRTVKNR